MTMLKWIELNRDDDKNVWIRIDTIFQIVPVLGEDGETPDGSMVVGINGSTFFVKELPDEIMVAVNVIEKDSKEYMMPNKDIMNVFFDRYPLEERARKEVRDGE